MSNNSTEQSQNESNGFFRNAWEGWKRIARKIGDFNARVILTLFYILLFSPFAIALRLFSDPLQIKGTENQGWIPRVDTEEITPLEKATRQF